MEPCIYEMMFSLELRSEFRIMNIGPTTVSVRDVNYLRLTFEITMNSSEFCFRIIGVATGARGLPPPHSGWKRRSWGVRKTVEKYPMQEMERPSIKSPSFKKINILQSNISQSNLSVNVFLTGKGFTSEQIITKVTTSIKNK